MAGKPGIQPANMTLSALMKSDVLKGLMNSEGENANLRYTSAKGLYVKRGVDNWFRDPYFRGGKYLDAAEVISAAIDRELPNERVMGKTAGQAFVDDQMKANDGKGCLTVRDVRALKERVDSRKKELGILMTDESDNPAESLSGFAASRTAQSETSRLKGVELMKQAVRDDLAEGREASLDIDILTNDSDNSAVDRCRTADEEKEIDREAQSILDSCIDESAGLNEKNLDKLTVYLRRKIMSTKNVEALYDVVNLQRKIIVAGKQLNKLTYELERLLDYLPSEMRNKLEIAIDNNRSIIEFLKNQRYPDGLDDPARENYIKVLRKNSNIILEVGGSLHSIADKKILDAVGRPLQELAFETLSLALSLLPAEDRFHVEDPAMVIPSNIDENETSFLAAWTFPLGQRKNGDAHGDAHGDDHGGAFGVKARAPETLYAMPCDTRTETCASLGDSYNQALDAAEDAFTQYKEHIGPKNTDYAYMKQLNKALHMALEKNDRMSESLNAAASICGVKIESEPEDGHLKANRRELQRVQLSIWLAAQRFRKNREDYSELSRQLGCDDSYKEISIVSSDSLKTLSRNASRQPSRRPSRQLSPLLRGGSPIPPSPDSRGRYGQGIVDFDTFNLDGDPPSNNSSDGEYSTTPPRKSRRQSLYDVNQIKAGASINLDTIAEMETDAVDGSDSEFANDSDTDKSRLEESAGNSAAEEADSDDGFGAPHHGGLTPPSNLTSESDNDD